MPQLLRILASFRAGQLDQAALLARLQQLAALPNLRLDELVVVILKDERINFAFAETDLTKFKHQLYTQLCELAAGPCIYDGRDMRTAHEKLPLTNAHFNALTEDLYIALDRVDVSYKLQNELVALLAPLQRDVVKK